MSIVVDVVLVLTVVVIALVLWGLVEPYLIDVTRREVELPRLPPAWEGRRLALIADLQVGMWLANTATIARIVRRIVHERPDAVLIAGDFVYEASGRPKFARRAAELVAPLTAAGLPTYAVLGNHDFAMPTKREPPDEALARAVRDALVEVGIEVLDNRAVALPGPGGDGGEPLYLVGIGAHVPGRDRPDEALSTVPAAAARIVMMHHPNSFDVLPHGAAPLAVAGHTHGGQFRVPFTPDWTWMTFTRDDHVHADGFEREPDGTGNRLYVNRGIGFSVMPLRLNCPPELTLFRLRRPAAPEARSGVDHRSSSVDSLTQHSRGLGASRPSRQRW